MPKVEAAKVNFTTAELSVTNAGVEAHAVAAKTETILYRGSLGTRNARALIPARRRC